MVKARGNRAADRKEKKKAKISFKAASNRQELDEAFNKAREKLSHKSLENVIDDYIREDKAEKSANKAFTDATATVKQKKLARSEPSSFSKIAKAMSSSSSARVPVRLTSAAEVESRIAKAMEAADKTSDEGFRQSAGRSTWQ